MDNILLITIPTPREIAIGVASRVKSRRLELDLTQEGLALKAGIALPTYRRFERTGKISFRGLLQIGFALNCLDDFDSLFSQRQYRTMDELLANKDIKRKRGHKHE